MIIMSLDMAMKFTLNNGAYISCLLCVYYRNICFHLNVITMILNSKVANGIGSVNGGRATRSGGTIGKSGIGPSTSM
jgi:hypothetical protein